MFCGNKKIKRLDSCTLRCETSAGLNANNLVTSLVNTALFSPETSNPFSSIRKKKDQEQLKRWKPKSEKPVILEIPAERSSSELPNPFLTPRKTDFDIPRNPFSPTPRARFHNSSEMKSPTILPIQDTRNRINSISELVERENFDGLPKNDQVPAKPMRVARIRNSTIQKALNRKSLEELQGRD